LHVRSTAPCTNRSPPAAAPISVFGAMVGLRSVFVAAGVAGAAARAPTACSSADSVGVCGATSALSSPPSLLQRKSDLQQRGAHIALSDNAVGECCNAFSEWPHVDHDVTCDGCMALVETHPYGGRCDRYCESFGHVCVSAAEELDESCQVKYTARCNEPIVRTSDMLCKCRLPADQCPGVPGPIIAPPPPTWGLKRIEVRGRQLLVEGQPMHLKGMAWNPVRKGDRHPSGLDFPAFVDRDVELFAQAGVNAVRTYEAILDLDVLDKLWSRGIWVINGVYSFGGLAPSTVIDKINRVKHHPALLMWSVGNEWNYNGLYTGMPFWDSVGRLQEVAAIIKRHDQEHPVACVYGELGNLREADQHMPDVDVWGVNSYRGISFGDLFDAYGAISPKPLFLGEYGADAFNALVGHEDQGAQAKALGELTKEIVAHSSVRPGGVCIGGFVFELADEWWKDDEGSAWTHDIGGTAPGAGPYPDMVFNEEWWGLVDIDRRPRLALDALREVGIPIAAIK